MSKLKRNLIKDWDKDICPLHHWVGTEWGVPKGEGRCLLFTL